MKKTITIVLLFLTSVANAQHDSLILLKRRISFYSDGKPKELITYNSDSCRYIDFYGDCQETEDHCYDGLYQKWHKNGQLKIHGQYEYKLHHDTIPNCSEETGEMELEIISYLRSNKTGLWMEYDSNGNRLDTKRYIKDKLIAIQYPRKDTLINVNEDSTWIKIVDYSKYTAYNFNYRKNCKLTLQFPTYTSHNYWLITKDKIDLIFGDFSTYNVFNWDKGLVILIADDTCGDNCRNYYEFSNLQNGRYYVYYWSFKGIFYEIEIVLNGF